TSSSRTRTTSSDALNPQYSFFGRLSCWELSWCFSICIRERKFSALSRLFRRLHRLRARSDSFFTHDQKASRFAERNALRQIGKNVAILSQLIANRFRG